MNISVIIPTYNVEEHIARTLTTVLNQTIKPLEIIVCDDGSIDKTCEIVQSFGVKLIKQSNQGAAAARNNAISYASGEWIAFLDSDDEWLPDRIKNLIEHHKIHPDSIMIANDEFEGPVGGPWIQKNLHEKFNTEIPLFPQVFRSCFLSTSAMAVKKEAFLKVGGMDISLRYAQDYDLWLRLAQKGKLSFIKLPLSRYILREGNNTSQSFSRYRCLLKIVEKFRRSVSCKDYIQKIMFIHYETSQELINKKRYISALSVVIIMPIICIKQYINYFKKVE